MEFFFFAEPFQFFTKEFLKVLVPYPVNMVVNQSKEVACRLFKLIPMVLSEDNPSIVVIQLVLEGSAIYQLYHFDSIIGFQFVWTAKFDSLGNQLED